MYTNTSTHFFNVILAVVFKISSIMVKVYIYNTSICKIENRAYSTFGSSVNFFKNTETTTHFFTNAYFNVQMWTVSVHLNISFPYFKPNL